MGKPRASICRFGRPSQVVLAASLLLAGCSSDPEPLAYSVGDTIELGLFNLRIVRAERVPNLNPYYRSSLLREGEKAIAVHVVWSGLEQIDRPAMIVGAFLEDRLTILDDAGDQYAADDAVSAREFAGHLPTIGGPSRGPSRSFVVTFPIHEDSRDLILLIEHPDPPDRDSRLLAVPLGM